MQADDASLESVRRLASHRPRCVARSIEANAGNASLASRTRSQWHKFVLTRHFFELGYEWLLFADALRPARYNGATASRRRTNLKSSDLTGAHLKPDHKEFGAGNTTELVISRDRGHPGFYGPPIGPTNTGVWLLKNGSLARLSV